MGKLSIMKGAGSTLGECLEEWWFRETRAKAKNFTPQKRQGDWALALGTGMSGVWERGLHIVSWNKKRITKVESILEQ